MAQIEISISRSFETPADTDTVWQLLADTRRTLAHYPDLENLVDLGGDQWRWELAPAGVRGISHQVVYSVHYHFNREDGIIAWEPLGADTDNAHIRGGFEIADTGNGSRVTLRTDGELQVPVPRLLSSAAKAVVEREFRQQIETFMANLEETLTV